MRHAIREAMSLAELARGSCNQRRRQRFRSATGEPGPHRRLPRQRRLEPHGRAIVHLRPVEADDWIFAGTRRQDPDARRGAWGGRPRQVDLAEESGERQRPDTPVPSFG